MCDPPNISDEEMSPTTQIVEHIVLFKVKDNTDSTKIISILNSLNNLITIHQVLHLSAAPIHRLSSTSTSVFTHILHSRYKSKEDLNAYTNHPNHLLVVNESLPIFEDILAVDWIADQIAGNLTPISGSVARITLLKVKENLSDEVKMEIMEVVKEKLPGSVGENFSPIRAKGFSIGSIAFCNDLGEMDTNMDKVLDYLDDTIVVEFVVSSSSQSKLE